ncbi:MAG: aromatic-ring-hydroxylating dioxygenase subunit beta [Burkholderiales bacterium]
MSSKPDSIAGITLTEAEQLLYREAFTLDRHRFDEWLALFTDDATYWLPLEEGQIDPIETSSIVYDNRELMGLRVKQYREARAHARLPLARTAHQISNVMLDETQTATLDVSVASTLVLVEYRQERQRVWGALVTHRIRRTSAGLRIAAKRIDLVNSEAELDGIAFLL